MIGGVKARAQISEVVTGGTLLGKDSPWSQPRPGPVRASKEPVRGLDDSTELWACERNIVRSTKELVVPRIRRPAQRSCGTPERAVDCLDLTAREGDRLTSHRADSRNRAPVRPKMGLTLESWLTERVRIS